MVGKTLKTKTKFVPSRYQKIETGTKLVQIKFKLAPLHQSETKEIQNYTKMCTKEVEIGI